MQSNKLKISIITINLNNSSGLQKTLESIICQNYNNYELIVIDGLSSDNSLEIIKKYSKNISFWVSESDNGIYNAMNKGTLKATGEYLYYLNSGDVFYNETVLSNIFSTNDSIDTFLISGNVELIFETGKSRVWETKEFYRFSEIAYGHIPHQGFFFNRIVFQKYGMYNEKLRIVGDWEFILKLIFMNVSILHKNIIFAKHFLDGISQNDLLFNVQIKERKATLESYKSLFEDMSELITSRNFFRFAFFRIKASLKYRLYR